MIKGFCSILFLLIPGILCAVTSVELLYDATIDLEDGDPSFQSWTPNSSNNSTNSFKFTADDAWRIKDETNSQLPGFSQTIDSGTSELINDTGFNWTFKVRAVANHDLAFAGEDWAAFIEFQIPAAYLPGNSAKRIGFAVGRQSDKFQIFNEQEVNPTLADYDNSGTDFHTIEVIYNPGETTYSWSLNGGAIKTLDLEGGSNFSFSEPKVTFSSGITSGYGGTTDWKLISLRSLEADTTPAPTAPVTGTVLLTGDGDSYYYDRDDMTGLLALSEATSADVSLDISNSSPGIYRLDIVGSNDTGDGALISTVANNGKYLGGYTSGSNYASNSVVPLSGPRKYNIVTSRADNDIDRYDIDAAFGWFPFSEYLGGVATGSGNDPSLTELNASPGISLGSQVIEIGVGQTLIDLTNLDAHSSDGILLASSAELDSNVATVEANDDGTFTVYIRENISNDSLEQGALSFVYLPLESAGTPSQLLAACGRAQSNATTPVGGGRYHLRKLADEGRWALAIPGHNPDTGTLLLTSGGGGSNNFDNIVSYEWDPVAYSWIIQCRDGDYAAYGLDGGATEDEVMFNFAFFAKEPLTTYVEPTLMDAAFAREIRPHGDSLIGSGIDTATGAFTQGRELLKVDGVRPLSLDITYNSLFTSEAGPLGTSWSHNYQVRLEGNDREDLVIRWDAHRYSRFEYQDTATDGRYYEGIDEDVRYARLTARSPEPSAESDPNYSSPDPFPDAFWELLMPDGETYYFGIDGRLTSVFNVIEQPIHLGYDDAARLVTLTEPFSGAALSLDYNDLDLIESISDELGRIVTLSYDAQSRLITIPSPFFAEEEAYGELPSSVTIPDNNMEGGSTTVSVVEGGTISGIQIRSLEIAHALPAQLDITITSPAGTIANLLVADAEIEGNIISFDEDIFTVFDNEDSMGDWELKVVDNVDGAVGSIVSFSFSFITSTRTIEYTYDDANRIIKADDAMGDLIMGASYDTLGRITRQEDGRPDTPDATITYNKNSDTDETETLYTDPLSHIWRFTHDAEYHLISMTDPLGGTARFTYDTDGNRVSSTNAKNRITTFTYNETGNVASMTDPLGHTTSFEYGDTYDVVRIVDALGRATEMERENGRLTMVTDASGTTDLKEYFDNGQVSRYAQSVSFGYNPDPAYESEEGQADISYALDENKRIALISNPDDDDIEQSIEYDRAGRVTSSVDFGGNKTKIFYTAAGEVRTQIDAKDNAMRRDYDHRGQLIRTIDRRGVVTAYTYDGNGNITKATNGIGQETSFTYDHDDRLIERTNELGYTTTYEYDALGRVIKSTDPLGNSVRTVYDTVGNLIETYDASDQLTLKITYDARDLPIRLEDALGQTVEAEYDAVMRKTKITEGQTADGSERVTEYFYDELDRMVAVKDPSGRDGGVEYFSDDLVQAVQPAGGSSYTIQYNKSNELTGIVRLNGDLESFTYNSRGLLTKSTSEAGRESSYEYDDLGQMIKSSAKSDSTRTYTYDDSGNLLTVKTINNGSEKQQSLRSYDPLGRIDTFTDYSLTNSGQKLIYGYDSAGNLATLTYPDNTTIYYSYDASNRLVEVKDWADRITQLTWDTFDRLVAITFPNGTQRNMRYDGVGNLIFREDLDRDDATIIAYAFGYDAAGMLRSEVTTPELPAAIPTPAKYTFDEYNIIETYNDVAVTVDEDGFVINAEAAGAHLSSLSYNGRGKLASSAGYEYHYDEEDRLVGWQQSGTNESERTHFFANPSGRMSQILMQTDSGGAPIKKYLYGVGLFYEEDANTGEIKVFHYDYRGSTVALSGNDGQVIGRIAYSSYGEITSRTNDTNTIFLYNGLYGVVTSPEELNYMRFRWYAPELRRFLSRDAHLGSIASLSSLNRYTYAGGNPAMYIDPEGEAFWILGGAAAGAAINVAVTFAIDIADGKVDTEWEVYAAAAIGGAVQGAITTGTLGLGGAIIGGGLGGAAENLALAAFRGEEVNPQELAFATMSGAGSATLGYGGGKLVGKATGKIGGKLKAKVYAKTFGKPGKFLKMINKVSTPEKVSRRRAIGSLNELVERANKKAAKDKLTKTALKAILLPPAAYVYTKHTLDPPLFFDGEGGAGSAGKGDFSIVNQALNGLNLNSFKNYGEYIHYDLYMDATRLADRPIPSHPAHTVTGF